MAGGSVEKEFRIADCEMRGKESGVRIQNPGGKDIKTVHPFWLLTTGYLSKVVSMNEHSNLLDRHNKYFRYLLVLSFITFLILVAATSAQGACLSIDAVTTGTTASDTSISMTVSHTTGSDSDRLMLVAISVNVNDDERVTTVTYGGTPLTKVGERNNDNDAMVYIYSLVAPNPGTANVVINFTSALNYGALAGVMTFTGVHQSTPLGTFASAIGNDSTPASVDISSAPGELVFGVAASEYDAFTTASSGQDVHWNTSLSVVQAPMGRGGPTVAHPRSQ